MKYSTLSLLFLIFFSSLLFSCDKNDPDPNNGGIVTDIDGNKYHTVTIGSQVWMVENLKTTRFRNGDPIPYLSQPPTSEYGGYGYEVTDSVGYCDYEDSEELASKFGRLYNWFAVRDERKIAPEGWHIPSNDEWNVLVEFIQKNRGISETTAKALAAKTDWEGSTLSGTAGNNPSINNSSGFTALPAGYRYSSGSFSGYGEIAVWWCNNDKELTEIQYPDEMEVEYYHQAPARYIDYGRYESMIDDVNIAKELVQMRGDVNFCFSIRCIKD